MIFYPKLYLKDVTKITMDILKKYDIRGLILDVDNTLIDIDRNMNENIKPWIDDLKQNGIKFCIVSNTGNLKKVTEVSEKLDIPFFYFAKKPFKKGFLKAKEKMELNEKNIAAVGDQIMTDVIGANRCKMFPILVEPVDKRDKIITRMKRPLEKCIIKKYEAKMQKEQV